MSPRTQATTQLGKLALGVADLGRSPGDYTDTTDYTSQIGIIQLGVMQLGYVDPNSGSPPVSVPDMSTWYVALSRPTFPIIEIESI